MVLYAPLVRLTGDVEVGQFGHEFRDREQTQAWISTGFRQLTRQQLLCNDDCGRARDFRAVILLRDQLPVAGVSLAIKAHAIHSPLHAAAESFPSPEA